MKNVLLLLSMPAILLSGSDSVIEFKKENPLILGRIAKHASNSNNALWEFHRTQKTGPH